MEKKEKVFGIGFSKTGTTSLEQALTILGYNVCKGRQDLKHNDYLAALYVNKAYDEIYRLTKYWNAFADGPWGGSDLYKKLYEWYPDAKFILTIRDPESWYNSYIRMVTKFTENRDLENAWDDFHAHGRYGSVYFFKHVFQIGTLAGNKDKIIGYFEKTNNDIKAFFKEKRNFLELNIIGGEGWEKLCDFLSHEIPQVDFPDVNKSVQNKNKRKKPHVPLRKRIKRRLINIADRL